MSADAVVVRRLTSADALLAARAVAAIMSGSDRGAIE